MPIHQGRSKGWEKRREPTLELYLMNRIEKALNGCWLWKTGAENRYPLAEYKNKSMPAHRASYEEFVGKIPVGLIVRHTCDNPKCINPEHLVLGTKKDNRQDFMKRHPRAKELCLTAAKIGARGVKKFWDNMSPGQRKKFTKRRAKAQQEKRNARSLL